MKAKKSKSSFLRKKPIRRRKSRTKAIKNRSKFVAIFAIALTIIFIFIYFAFKNQCNYYFTKGYYTITELLHLKENKETPVNLNENTFIPKGEIFGIDISRHQGNINWEKVNQFRFKYNKISFVYIKATESNSWNDFKFLENWKDAKKYGFYRGAYHFFDPNEDVKLQMELFFNQVKLEKGDLPPMLDVEEISNISTSNYRKKVKQCLDLMEAEYHTKPLLYINQSFYKSYFNTEEFSTYPLWISSLKTTEPSQKNWLLWQFTHSAIIPGIPELVDVNVFKGSEFDFNILLKK